MWKLSKENWGTGMKEKAVPPWWLNEDSFSSHQLFSLIYMMAEKSIHLLPREVPLYLCLLYMVSIFSFLEKKYKKSCFLKNSFSSVFLHILGFVTPTLSFSPQILLWTCSLFHKAVNTLNHLLSPSMILYIHKFMVQSPEHSKFRRFDMVIADTMESKHSQDQQNLKTTPLLFGLRGWLSW